MKNKDKSLLKNQEIKLSPYYIAYIDILGAKEMINSEKSEEFLQKINLLYQDTLIAIKSLFEDIEHITIEKKIFSDNIVIAIRKNKTDSITDDTIKHRLIFELASFFQVLALRYTFLTRGSIVIGDLYFDETFIYGKALTKAYELESNIAIYPRIIINDKNCSDYMYDDYIRSFITRDNSGICYINSFEKYFEVAKIYKQDEIKMLAYILLDKFNQVDSCKNAQKVFWLINEFNKFCQNNNFNDYIIDITQFSMNAKNYQY